MSTPLSFEGMPQAMASLIDKVDTLQPDVNEIKQRFQPVKEEEPMIGIDEAAKIIGRAKSTIYALAREKRIPYYQPGKFLQFKKSELIAWLEGGRSMTSDPMRELTQSVKRKPKSGW